MFELQSVRNLYENTIKKYPDAVVGETYRANDPRANDVDSMSYPDSWFTLLRHGGMPIKVGSYFDLATLKPRHGIDYNPTDALSTDHIITINQRLGRYAATITESVFDNNGDHYYHGYTKRHEKLNPIQLHKTVQALGSGAVVLSAEQSAEIQSVIGANHSNLTPNEVWSEFIPLAASLQQTRAV